MPRNQEISGKEYQQRVKELDLLLRLNEKIIRTLDLDEVLQLITDGMAELLEIETAAIYLLEDQNRLFLGATTPPMDPSMPDTLRWANVDDHPNIKIAIGQLKPHVIPDTQDATLSPAEMQVVELRKLRSLVFLPILNENDVTGVLILGTNNKARVYSAYEIELSQGIANQLALGIINARLHTELLQHNDELQQSIEERLQAEEALKTSQVQLSNALRIAKLGHWEYDVLNDQFTFTDEFYQVMRTSKESQGGYTMSAEEYANRFIPEDQREKVAEEIKRGIETSDPDYSNEIEHKIVYGDGKEGVILVRVRILKDATGKTITFYGANQDITQQKNIEEEILASRNTVLESEYLFRTLFDLAPEGIFLIRAEDNSIERMNKAFAAMHGYTVEEMQHMTLFDLNVYKDQTFIIYKDVLDKVMAGETVEFETEEYHKNGHLIPVKVIVRLLELKQEKYFLGFHRDLTSIKRHESELLEALEKARESDRLKSAFLANISHEIRTPLNAILGFSKFISKEDLPYQTRVEYQEIIDTSGKRLLDIISDILDISKIDTEQFTLYYDSCDVNDLVNQVLQQYKSQADKKGINLHVVSELKKESSTLKTDMTRVSQVLSNLVDNALKYTEEGRVIVSYRLKGDELEFSIEDNGIGIDPENHEMIFERFQQVDNEYTKGGSGSGLGLSIAKGIIGIMGGRIWVESEAGKGADFRFTIPYEPVRISTKTKKSDQLAEINRSFKVLVAEDEESNYQYINALLGHYDCEIVHAKNGKEALDLYIEQPDIDFILMDIKMPEMNGLDATKEIRKYDEKIPIVAQTAYAMEEDKHMAMDAGCDYYLPKPISPQRLTEIIATILN